MADLAATSRLPSALSLAAAQRDVTRQLREAGIDAPERDARLLLGAATGLGEIALITAPGRPLAEPERERLEAMLARRLAREPVSRILGSRGFYGRDFELTPATLDPRPDTETLVDAALAIAAEEGWCSRPIRILDVGTGSGALLVTLLAKLPLATGLGSDLSEAILAVARRNAVRQNVAERAQWRVARSLDGIDGPFDLLVSNPPYVPTPEIARLEPEVRAYDPRSALDGGDDGLDVYRALARGLSRVVPAGWVVLEVGAGQAGAVAELLQSSIAIPAGALRLQLDLGGHCRCVSVRTQAP
jgi:release factor glutamine methyltransferase